MAWRVLLGCIDQQRWVEETLIGLDNAAVWRQIDEERAGRAFSETRLDTFWKVQRGARQYTEMVNDDLRRRAKARKGRRDAREGERGGGQTVSALAIPGQGEL